MSDYLTYRGEYVEGLYPVHFDPWAIWRLSVSQHFLHGVNITAGVDNLFDHTPGVVSFNTSMNHGRKFFISMEIGVDELFNNKKQQINNN
jgi:outer membrane receptor for ferrienterochelin and colicins